MTEDRIKKNDDGDYVAHSYRKYLEIESITSHRELLTERTPPRVHDEFLFIEIHRNIEVWFFQMLAELNRARELIRDKRIADACEELGRVARIFDVLTQTWDVLATLRPREFWKFRDYFGDASGFQSAQFREVEFLLGHRASSADHLKIHGELLDFEAVQRLNVELNKPSLWDEVNLALKWAGHTLDDKVTGRAWRTTYAFSTPFWVKVRGEPEELEKPEKLEKVKFPGDRSVLNAWFDIYSDQTNEKFAPFYQLGERLLDISAAFAFWRFKHIVTVERFIGRLPGSGGSEGVPYLITTLDHKAFPELWTVRNLFRKWSKKYDPEDQRGAMAVDES